MTYSTEFPDFPEADMPAIPEGFVDVSWKNEGSPSFHSRALRLMLWVDYADPERRIVPGAERFALKRTDADGALLEGEEAYTFESSDWGAILAAIEAEADRLRRFKVGDHVEIATQRDGGPIVHLEAGPDDSGRFAVVKLGAGGYYLVWGDHDAYCDGARQEGDEHNEFPTLEAAREELAAAKAEMEDPK